MQPTDLDKLKVMGFSENLTSAVKQRLALGYRRFKLPDKVQVGEHLVRCLLYFIVLPDTNDLQLVKYEVMLQVVLDIPHISAGETDSRLVEKMMQEVNWNGREFTNAYLLEFARIDPELELQVAAIVKCLQALSVTPEGREVSERLRLKYWFDTHFNHDFLDYGDMDALRNRYYPSRTFTLQQGLPVLQEAIELLVRVGEVSAARQRRRQRKKGGSNKSK